MTNAPYFSVVTISYNQKRYLGQAMDSVLSQDSELFEYIVMDGASSDGSKELIESHADRLTYWQSCRDGGPSNALRNAVERCKGRYLVYINSDDMLLPGALRSMARYLDRYQDADVLYGHGISIDERESRLTRVYSDRWSTKAYARGLVSIFQQSCALRLDAVRSAGNFNSENRTCWDGELLFQMGRSGSKFSRVNDFFGLFRIHEDSITGSQNTSAQYVLDRKNMAKLVGVSRPLRGGMLSSVLKVMRDPVLMTRKAIDGLAEPKRIVVRGNDIGQWLAQLT